MVGAISSLAVTTTSITNGAITRPGLHATWTAVTDATIVAMRIQYRIQGDTTALEVAVVDPSQGSHTWVTGVQGSSGYEIRAIPVTRPERAVDWTSWKQTPASTAGQAVASAMTSVEVTSVPADTITPAMLSAQTRFELALATALETVQGSSAAALADTLDWAQQAAEAAIVGMLDAHQARTAIRVEQAERHTEDEALAQLITTVQTATSDNAARITDEITARTTADDAQALQMTTLTSQVGGHTASISSINSAIGGYAAKWSLALSVDNYVTGYVSLDGTATASTFGVLASNFYVAQPGVSGGDPKQIFTIGSVGGLPAIALHADLFSDGSITAAHLDVASLDAISGTFGALTAGTITSPDGKLFISSNSDAAEIRISS